MAPDPVFLKVFGFEIYWYSVFVTFGVFVALFFASRIFKERGLKEEYLYDCFFLCSFLGLFFARLYHVLTLLSYYLSDPIQILNLRGGGLAIFGAVFGGVLGILIFTKLKKENFFEFLNIAAIVLPLGQAIGRWGNFFNQELFGKPTNFFLKIYIEEENRPSWHKDFDFFHPLFLYESVVCFLIFLFLFLTRKRNFERSTGIYLFLYGLWRFFAEFLRDTETPTLFLRLEQWVSLVFLFLGIFLIFRGKFLSDAKRKESKKEL